MTPADPHPPGLRGLLSRLTRRHSRRGYSWAETRTVVERDFPPERTAQILRVLTAYDDDRYGLHGPRIRRAILVLANGDDEALRHYATAARTDFRDVLYWVELPD